MLKEEIAEGAKHGLEKDTSQPSLHTSEQEQSEGPRVQPTESNPPEDPSEPNQEDFATPHDPQAYDEDYDDYEPPFANPSQHQSKPYLGQPVQQALYSPPAPSQYSPHMYSQAYPTQSKAPGSHRSKGRNTEYGQYRHTPEHYGVQPGDSSYGHGYAYGDQCDYQYGHHGQRYLHNQHPHGKWEVGKHHNVQNECYDQYYDQPQYEQYGEEYDYNSYRSDHYGKKAQYNYETHHNSYKTQSKKGLYASHQAYTHNNQHYTNFKEDRFLQQGPIANRKYK